MRRIASASVALLALPWALGSSGFAQVAGIALFLFLSATLLRQGYWRQHWVEALALVGLLVALMAEKAIVLAVLLASPFLLLRVGRKWRGIQQTVGGT